MAISARRLLEVYTLQLCAAIKVHQHVPTRAQQQQLWQRLDDVRGRYRDRFLSVARQAFDDDKAEVLIILQQQKSIAITEHKAITSWKNIIEKIRDYFSTSDVWIRKLKQPVRQLVKEAIKEIANITGTQEADFDIDSYIGDIADNYLRQVVTHINDTSAASMLDLLDQADAEEWSFDVLRNNVTTVFEQWKTGAVADERRSGITSVPMIYRASVIADTSESGFVNTAIHDYADLINAPYRMWVSLMDGRERPEHHDAHEQVVPRGTPYIVGGEELMFPGDPNGSDWNIINCRCYELPIME